MPNPNASYQDELFKEFPQKTVGKRGLLVKNTLVAAKMVSFEQILFGVIGVLIGLVVAFSFGVERGKRLVKMYETPSLLIAERIEKPAESEPEKKIEAKKEEQKGFTIQVATYKNKKAAERLIHELRSNGKKSLLIPKGELLAVCVGEYVSSKEASKAVQLFKHEYPDCFARRL